MSTHLAHPSANDSSERRPTPAARKVLDAAAVLFCAKGYETTSIVEIAGALGIQKPTLYHHVSSKEQLLFDIVEDALTQVMDAARVAVERGPTPAAKVEALIHAHMRTMLANREYHYVMLTEHRSLSESHQRRLRQDHKTYGVLIATTLRAAQEAGVLRNDIASRHLAFLLTNLMNWTIFWYRSTGKLSPTEIASLIQTQFLHGAMMSAAR